MQTLLHGRRIRGCERCLVELADDRLRRATRQEDGEPGWRFKIRKPLLMSTGQIWQGRVYSRPRGRDFVVVSFSKERPMGSISKEEPMGSNRTSRRELLKGGGALAGGLTLGALAPALGRTPASDQPVAHDHSMSAYRR